MTNTFTPAEMREMADKVAGACPRRGQAGHVCGDCLCSHAASMLRYAADALDASVAFPDGTVPRDYRGGPPEGTFTVAAPPLAPSSEPIRTRSANASTGRMGWSENIRVDPPLTPVELQQAEDTRALLLGTVEKYRAMQEPSSEPSATQDFTQSFDATVWAEAFIDHVRKNPRIATDTGTMVGWFANALMRGFDEHARREPREPHAALLKAAMAVDVDAASWLSARFPDVDEAATLVSNMRHVLGRCRAALGEKG